MQFGTHTSAFFDKDTHRVTIIHNYTDWAAVITYHAIVPKMSDVDALEVEVGLVMP